MSILLADEQRLHRFFAEELHHCTTPQQQGSKEFSYVTSILTSMARMRPYKVLGNQALTLIIDELYGVEKRAQELMHGTFIERKRARRRLRWTYNQFRDIGDELLFLCGMMPEAVDNTHKRRLVGLEFYLNQGSLWYGEASTTLSKYVWLRNGSENPELFYRLSSEFRPWTRTLNSLRARFNKNSHQGEEFPENVIRLSEAYSMLRGPNL